MSMNFIKNINLKITFRSKVFPQKRLFKLFIQEDQFSKVNPIFFASMCIKSCYAKARLVLNS